MRYPETRKGDVVDVYGATRVADPYRWLEDLDSPEVAAWVAAQNAVTFAHLDTLPLREHLKRRLTELWDYPRTACRSSRTAGCSTRRTPACSGSRRSTCAPASSIRRRSSSIPTCSRRTDRSRSRNTRRHRMRRLIVYAIAEGGADWETLRVRNVATGEDLSDVVSWVRFSDLSWTHDSKGFFYSRYPEPPAGKVLEAALSNQAIYYHRVGTPQSDDVLIYQRLDHPAWIVNATVSEDGRYVFIRTFRGADNNNQLHFIDLGDPGAAERSPRRSSRSSKRSTPNTRRSATIRRASICAPTRTRRTAASSRSISSTSSVTAGRSWCPNSRTRSRTPRSSAGASWFIRSSTCRAAFNCSRSTAPTKPTFRCPASAPSPISTGGRTTTICGSPSARRSRRRRCIDTISSRARACRSKRLGRRSTPSQFETRAMFATSKDGTRVPFFMTSKKGLPQDGAQPGDALRIRRLLDQRAALLSLRCAGVARAGRRVRLGEHARRRRIRRGLAQGRLSRTQAERVRRLHRRRRASRARSATPRPIVSASWADRTAGCWSAR